MTSVDTMKTATQRRGWVTFNDDSPLTSVRYKKDDNHGVAQTDPHPTQQTCPLTTAPKSTVFNPQSSPENRSWIQFVDKPWSNVQPQATCSSVGAPNQNLCSSVSFWSPAPPSETSRTARSEDPSFLSITPSYTDLQSNSTEDQQSSGMSRADSPNSSVFQEDEDIDMDAANWLQTDKQMNGQSDRKKTRFASWVTFDDDEDSCFLPSPKPLKVDNFSLAPTQDSNSNLMISEGHSLKTEVTRNLFDLTPEKTNYVFTPDSPPANTRTPCSKINPFLDSKLLDVQPSPINPFSAYFDKQEPPLVDTSESNGSGSPQVYSFSSPFLTEGVDVKRDSVLLFSPVFDTSIHEDMFNNVPQNQTLEQLKQMQIADEADNPTMPDEPIDSDELDEPPFVPSHLEPKDGWPMMLRIPEKKSMMSSRHWGVIHVKLTEAGCLQLYYEKGMAKPFKTLQLNANHGLSEPKLQTFDENGKIHTIRIDHVTYKEKKKYQPKVAVVHTPIIEQIVKLGTKNYEDFLSFISAVQNTLMSLPLDVDTYLRPSNYLEDEISIEVRDEFCGVVAKGDNRILRQSVVTHVSVLAFVSGTPVCRIGFNDVQIKGNEVVSRHDIVPNSTTRWIKLRDCQFNKYVDEKEFANTRSIAFVPPSAHRFELMRFRTAFAEKTLPFTLKTIATVKGAEVELQSWLVTSSGFSSNRDPLTLVPCENVMIRYPVGQTLIKNFRRESVTGEKSLKAKMNKGASFSSSSVSGTEPVMRVTLGTAKYEHAFKAVVWRINRLPDKNSASGHPHSFFFHLELGSDREVHSMFARHLDVEFDMPAASASKATVRSLSVGEKSDVKKWVSYKAHYCYQVEVELKIDQMQEMNGTQTDQPNECGQQ